MLKVWYVHSHIFVTLPVLVQWHGLRPHAAGFVPLSLAELSLSQTHTFGLVP